MKIWLLLLAAAGFFARPADAAVLWMQFEGSLTEVTLYPSDTVNVEIWVDLLAGDDLVSVSYPNWPDTTFEPYPFPSVEGLDQVAIMPGPDLGVTWSGGGSVGGPLGDGSQQVHLAGNTEDRLIGPGSFLVGIQTLHQNEVLNSDSAYFNGQYGFDFYPVMFGGDVSYDSQLVNSAGESYLFTIPAMAGYSGYYTWGQGSSVAGPKSGPFDDPLIVHCIPEPASLALLLLGSVAVIRRR